MTEISPERTAIIQQVSVLVQELYDALESQNIEQILAAQQNLTRVVETFWAEAEGDAALAAREKAVLRVLAGAAIKDLPEKVKEPANYARIKQELRLFKISAELL